MSRIGIAKVASLAMRIILACQISPGVKIGKRLSLAYGGLGVVIHGSTIIGDDVQIGCSVVIGGNLGKGGVPLIQDRVFIGPGAKILGPVVIGSDSIIAANSVILTDVPSGAIYAGVPGRLKRYKWINY
jgi:serine O-acetyltransferase